MIGAVHVVAVVMTILFAALVVGCRVIAQVIVFTHIRPLLRRAGSSGLAGFLALREERELERYDELVSPDTDQLRYSASVRVLRKRELLFAGLCGVMLVVTLATES
jgi:hypothetical protein